MELHDELLRTIDDCLQCSICQDIFNNPVTLHCGHSYCMKCICAHLKGKPPARKDCPECRGKIRPGTQFKKNVTLCNMVQVYIDHTKFKTNVTLTLCDTVNVSNDESAGSKTEVEVCEASQQTSASLEWYQEQPETPDDPCPEVTAPENRDPCKESQISSPSKDRHRAQDFPPPLPDAIFSRLTLTAALGHRRLAFQEAGRRVVTRRSAAASSALHSGDRFDVSQCMAEQEFGRGAGGRHFWDADTSGSAGWALGMARPDIGRGDQLGRGPASWCLEWSRGRLGYWHDGAEEPVKHGRPGLVRVVLGAGRGALWFYGLADDSEGQTLLHCVGEGVSGPVRPVFWLYGLQVPNALSLLEYEGVIV